MANSSLCTCLYDKDGNRIHVSTCRVHGKQRRARGVAAIALALAVAACPIVSTTETHWRPGIKHVQSLIDIGVLDQEW